MIDEVKKIVAVAALICSFGLGVLGIHRASLKRSEYHTITGRVTAKQLKNRAPNRPGGRYALVFGLANGPRKIAINLGSKNQADGDPAFSLIDTGKTYTFYLDPTVPEINGVTSGIDRIDYNGTEVYRASNKVNLYGGIFLCLFSLTGMWFVLKYAKKESN